MNEVSKFNIGLVLSGGGARGFAHIGVFKALKEVGMLPEIISGASMGSVVGALIANGYSPEEIVEIAKDKAHAKLFKMSISSLSLVSHEPVRKILAMLLPEKFEDLKIPLYLSSSNLTTGENVILSEGNYIM